MHNLYISRQLEQNWDMLTQMLLTIQLFEYWKQISQYVTFAAQQENFFQYYSISCTRSFQKYVFGINIINNNINNDNWSDVQSYFLKLKSA